jgi:hypothetical protein
MQWTPESLRATIASTQALADAFATANANGSGTIRGEQAVKFLRPSGLSDGALSRIWKLSTRGTGSLGSPAALAECLELVAKELENPSDGALVSTPAGHVKSAGGLSAGTPRTPASASVESVQAAPMTEAERKKYFGHFRTLDTQGKGTVSVDGAVKFLSKASLPLLSVQLCVARASRGASTIDRDMFAVAMHDVYALIRAQGENSVDPGADSRGSGTGAIGAREELDGAGRQLFLEHGRAERWGVRDRLCGEIVRFAPWWTERRVSGAVGAHRRGEQIGERG